MEAGGGGGGGGGEGAYVCMSVERWCADGTSVSTSLYNVYTCK